jgi:DNA repair photolyase
MNMIYEPKGRAREYAALACNVYSGCDHACIYCYAPSALHKYRENFIIPSVRKNFLENVEKESANIKTNERVLLSFTCDPYQKFDEKEMVTRETIKILKRNGIAIQVLTKGGSRALRDIDLFDKKDAFATTLTLLNKGHSEKWEPGAAFPHDRIETIKQFHNAGITTWVSLEPVLNPDSAIEIIKQTCEFVDLYKVGKLNYHPLAKSIDWRKFANDVIQLLDSIGKAYYIKNDLRAHIIQSTPA